MGPGDFEFTIGHRFSDPELLRRALTHRSFGASHNERLEYLGDSVVNCVVALELYHKFPALPEGELSRLRANLVNQHSLAAIAQLMGFMRARRSARGNGRPAKRAVLEPDIDLDRRIAAAVQDLAPDDVDDGSHRVVLALSKACALRVRGAF